MTVAVLEKEREVAAHQTGHNSGVIHAGIYYKPGSQMAKCCVRGADLMYEYCKEHQLPVERCGKLIVAVNEQEHKTVEKLMETATLNGVKDLQILNSEEVSKHSFEKKNHLYIKNKGKMEDHQSSLLDRHIVIILIETH